jgi:hypothetical protein
MSKPDQQDDDTFTLQNDVPPEKPEQFETKGGKQMPLIRGLMDCPGQQDLFPDLAAS